MNIKRLAGYAALLWLVIMVGIGIIAYESYIPPSQRSIRTFVLAAYGTQTTQQSADFTRHAGNVLSVGYKNGSFLPDAGACWSIPWNNMRSLAANNNVYELAVIVVGAAAHSNIPNARFSVFANNERIANRALTLAPDSTPPTYTSATTRVEDIELAPLDHVTASSFDLPRQLLASGRNISICLRTAGYAAWDVERAGVVLRYSPREPVSVSANLVVGLAALSAAICIFLAAGFLWAARRLHLALGSSGIAAAALICAVGLLAQDQWDFPTWLTILDIGSFKGGSTALYWAGTPLWAYVPLLVSPIVRFIGMYPWADSIAINAYFLKIIFIVAALLTSCAFFATERWRKPITLLFLVSPLTLWAVAWGARDVVSGLFAAVGLFALFSRGRTALWSILPIALACSVDEYYAPLLFAPALFVVAVNIRDVRRWGGALLLTCIGFSLVVLQWLLLPRAYASAILKYRTASSANFGSASVEYIFRYFGGGLHVASGYHELAIALYTALGACALYFLWSAFTRNWGRSAVERRGMMLIMATLFAFFLWYQIANPQEWYGVALVLFASGRVFQLSPRLGTIFAAFAGLEIYTHFGFREFLNPYIFQTSDQGLFGVRGSADIFLTCVCLCILALLTAALAAGRIRWLHSRSTSALATLLVLIVAVQYAVPAEWNIADAMILAGASVVLIGAMGDFRRIAKRFVKSSIKLSLANPVISAVAATMATLLAIERGLPTTILAMSLALAFMHRTILAPLDWLFVCLSVFCVGNAISWNIAWPDGITNVALAAAAVGALAVAAKLKHSRNCIST